MEINYWHIREEKPEDINAVRQVVSAAFGRNNEAELVDALHRRGAVICSLVAVLDDQIIGHILFTPATIKSSARASEVAALGPLAVLPAHQQQGIGTKLTTAGLERCRIAGYGVAIVLGHPDYYPRFGFRPSVEFGIRWEFDVAPEAFMVLELVPGALTGIEGIAHYQPEFNLV